MLAGRKLLLADDSITIQKVVALTFADEGVEVVTASDGHEAVEKLESVMPDVVLADVFMPGINGYEVCNYIKQNAQLKHIPVMLLVGSFEPFDEAEARRVGADDILTKPFQSIRRLIDKVGGLVSGKPAADDVETAELPPVENEPEDEGLSTEELEITTADTQPLPLDQLPADLLHNTVAEAAPIPPAPAAQTDKPEDEKKMDSPSINPAIELRRDSSLDENDVLLDLGDIGATSDASLDDFVLDLDLEEPVSAKVVEATPPQGFVEPQLSQAGTLGWDVRTENSMMASPGAAPVEPQIAVPDEAPVSDYSGVSGNDRQFADTQEWMRGHALAATDRIGQETLGASTTKLERVFDEPVDRGAAGSEAGQIDLSRLSPAAIDAIARRAVEQLSERVVQEIAWEVVPQLAELLIKRKLEDEKSLPK